MKATSAALVFCIVVLFAPIEAFGQFQAGAAVVDVTPLEFPVFVNGGMISRSEDTVTTKVNARAIVLDDGRERLGIVVVDSCMMPRPLLDEAKALASQRTKIRPDRMLISASHSARRRSALSATGSAASRSRRTCGAWIASSCSRPALRPTPT